MEYTKKEKLILARNILIIIIIFNCLLFINVFIFLEEGLSGYDKRSHFLPTIVSIIIGYLLTKNQLLNNRYLEEKNKAEESLIEKQILLREVHHRVKNNLQVITSLLSLQSLSIDDEKTKNIFRQSQMRINSMAKVHELLYQTENMNSIDLKKYIDAVCHNIMISFDNLSSGINIQINIEDISLNIETLIPLGLITTELLTNSIKYAFPDTNNKTIRIKIVRSAKGNFSYTLEDNGIGYDDKKIRKNSIGLKLVSKLTKQISGSLKKTSDSSGTKHSIIFSEVIH